jgi:hypothetical protein
MVAIPRTTIRTQPEEYEAHVIGFFVRVLLRPAE